jgi:DNA-nicking Smr family endonuclease
MTKPDFSEMLERYLPDQQESRRRELAEAAVQAVVHQKRALPIEARCDLHGMNVEQARRAVDSFLKDCVTRGLCKVLIIHGKGSGILRESILSYLEGHPLAGQRETASLVEGGRGALVLMVRKKKPAP